jgi:putative membrane-bound dehydrogenase-like protein
MTLFASEPDIVDPVGLTFDEDGRVYVVEMRDYPYGFGPDRKPGGTIRLLEDTNNDGRIDRSVLFAEGLSFPTSVAPWNGGVIVTAPPELVFLKDTDGDGKADVREVLLKGFILGVTDSNVNGLRWGLDNRLHGVNGGNGGTIVSTRRPGAPVPLRNFDFSFDPGSGDFTPTFHTSSGFGLVFDDWGRSFVTYNINHLQQRMIPTRYLARYPGFPPVEATSSISDHGEMSRIYPVSEPETRVNHPEQSGHFSSAGGMGFIGWSGYPADLPGSILVCDVVGNLVHRDVLEPDGPIFVARRSPTEQTREFFGSREGSFRPVGIELGPDGALYLIDMQRDVIEHPDYIPEKVKAKLDIRAGQDRGRIYRITPKGGLPHTKVKLRNSKTAGLISLLGHSNQWWRTTAQRLLVERQDRDAVPALKRLARDAHPLARLHALWTLLGMKSLDEPLVRSVLADQRAGVRENALLLAEALLPGSERLQQRVLALAEDPSPRVRFQAALTLGQFKHADSAAALRRIYIRDQAHRWSRLAVMSSTPDGEAALLQSLLATVTTQSPVADSALEGLRELADLCGARTALNPDRLETVLKSLPSGPAMEQARLAVLEGIQSGLGRTGGKTTASPAVQAALDKLGREGSPALMAAAWRLARALGFPESDAQRSALDAARRRVADVTRPTPQRVEDIQLLALGSYSAVGETLGALLEGAQPTAVQQAAIEALRQFNETTVATNLVSRWRLLAPSTRTAVINLLLQRVAFHESLVEAVEQGRIQLGELNLDLEQRRRLLRESSAPIMARAARLIGDEEYSNRKKIVEDWLTRLPPEGDALRGRAPFEKLCAQCHSLDGLGHPVGPDLTALAHRSVEDLLSNILDPNRAIHPNYVSYTAETVGGEIETGILQTESAETVVLLQAHGRTVTLARKQINRLESSGLSLMPEGLEAGMTPAELRDLIAFIQQRR